MGWRSVLIASVLVLTTGCVATPDWYRKYQQPNRAHPDLARRTQGVGVVGLLPPTIKIYELSAGGDTELRDDCSTAGRDSVLKAPADAFKNRGIALKPLAVDKDLATFEQVVTTFKVIQA